MPNHAHKMVDGTDHFKLLDKLLIRITNFNDHGRACGKFIEGNKSCNQPSVLFIQKGNCW